MDRYEQLFRRHLPWAFDGPDIWLSVQVPAGLHRASLYFHNKDGQSNTDRFRDFIVEIKGVASENPDAPDAETELKTRVEAVQALRRQLIAARAKFAADSPEVSALEKQLADARALMTQRIAGAAPETDDAELRRVDGLPSQARTRVTDFWGGVLQTVRLARPGDLPLQSPAQPLNGTTMAGVMLDAVARPERRGADSAPRRYRG